MGAQQPKKGAADLHGAISALCQIIGPLRLDQKTEKYSCNCNKSPQVKFSTKLILDSKLEYDSCNQKLPHVN